MALPLRSTLQGRGVSKCMKSLGNQQPRSRSMTSPAHNPAHDTSPEGSFEALSHDLHAALDRDLSQPRQAAQRPALAALQRPASSPPGASTGGGGVAKVG